MKHLHLTTKKALKTYTHLLFMGIVLLLSACGTTPFCNTKSTNSGLILDNAPILCLNKVTAQGHVIRSINDLVLLGDSSCIPSNIDFSNESLLAISASGGGCDIGFEREVTSTPSEKKMHYKVTVHTCGQCKKLGSSDNIVRVPKIPEDWTVTFEVDKE